MGEYRPLGSVRLGLAFEAQQDADYIIFLWRSKYYQIAECEDDTATANTMLFSVTKHCDGATNEVIAAVLGVGEYFKT